MANKGIRILEIERLSAADRAGLVSGDRILTANGHTIEDELALKFYLSDEQTDLYIRHSCGIEEHVWVDLSEGNDLGVRVEEFRTRTCNNACLFCFVDQLPPGVRPGLRLKDDDYRLSFLHGNYITLTNLTEIELKRIIEQRLSPLYVSVHATDPDLRTRILGRESADNLKQKLDTLIRGGIQIHAQVVLIPGINDGKHLEKTIKDLYGHYPGVQSVAIVPVGLSAHGKPKDRLAPMTPDFSKKVIRAVTRWQVRFRAQTGRTFAYLADEFYLQGKIDIPDRDYYDDFAQIEDGIGMTRSFWDEFEAEMNRRRKSRSHLHGTLVSGRLFAPILKRCIARFNDKFGSRLKVCAAENQFLGKSITVAGLLGGQDILCALDGKTIGDFLIIPNEAISQTEGIMVDGLSLRDLSASLGRTAFASGRTMREFFALLFSL